MTNVSRPAAIVWLRNDLRLTDNPALTAAVQHSPIVVAVYVHETDPSLRPIGAAARWWLHQSLEDLGAKLAHLGIRLVVEKGEAGSVLARLIDAHHASGLFWNRRYEPAARQLDEALKLRFGAAGLAVQSFSASLLVEPFDIATAAGTPFAVFTPFWNTLRRRSIPLPCPAIKGTVAIDVPREGFDTSYREPAWAKPWTDRWTVGEAAAKRSLFRFLDGDIGQYPAGRDFPALDATSSLSPHLRFGEIGPRQIWHAATTLSVREPQLAPAIDKFLSELGWREFSYNLLYHRKDIATVAMQARFNGMPWRDDPAALRAWQRGETGFPIIDAGMRQLWASGWMHNRVRMLTASLFSKSLLLDWRLGESWFWDTLVDADAANNPTGWQWVAGCGADAAPYFRIFNPATQGERFDAAGDYVRRWVPELRRLPQKWIHKPWAAPADVLAAAGVDLGRTYPAPVVDLKASRERALAVLSNS